MSPGAFASLNFSVRVGDSAANVAENLSRAGESLGISADKIFFPSQVHGRRVRTLARNAEPMQLVFEEADSLVSSEPGLGCGVRSADCVPVLIADLANGAVAAVHAGWRGVVAGVVAAALEELQRQPGSGSRCIAAIGPHISRTAFEVSEEVANAVADAAGDARVIDRSLGAKPHIDLRHAVRLQLVKGGCGSASIDDVQGCTYTDAERFFSFRRDGERSGRHISIILARAG